MALLQAGRAFEAVEVTLREKPASLRALSPKATVPVLHLPDGSVIEESWDIMRWALAEPAPQGWWARAQSADNLALVQRNDGDCATDLALMPFVRQYAAVDPDWFAAQHLPAVQAWLRGWLANPLFIACMQKSPVAA